MSNVDRFDLEQQILSVWQITSELETLSEAVVESNLTADQTANILIGVEQLYNLKFEKLFATFEQLVHNRQIV
jgi:hypothetical protein